MQRTYHYIFHFCLFFLFFSCSDDAIESSGKKSKNIVSSRIFNAEFAMTDSIYTRIFVKAPIVEEYGFSKTPYTLFPKGLEMNFYEKDKTAPGYLKAGYAKVIEQTGWYEAKKNVVIINSDKDTLKTEQIFWDKGSRKIFSNDTVRIYRADGVTTNISSKGIEASEDFKNFKLKGNTGTLPYNDALKTKGK